MERLENLGVLCWRERVEIDVAPQSRVELLHIAHAAAHHNAIGIQGVDDLSQTPGQAVHIKIKTLNRLGLALSHGLNDEGRLNALPS